MNVLFGEGVPEVFQELPRPVQVKAARIIDLIVVFPEMYPVRRIGLMRGYRYFNALGYYFYSRSLRARFASQRFYRLGCNKRNG